MTRRNRVLAFAAAVGLAAMSSCGEDVESILGVEAHVSLGSCPLPGPVLELVLHPASLPSPDAVKGRFEKQLIVFGGTRVAASELPVTVSGTRVGFASADPMRVTAVFAPDGIETSCADAEFVCFGASETFTPDESKKEQVSIALTETASCSAWAVGE